jgi:hypothetical protein
MHFNLAYDGVLVAMPVAGALALFKGDKPERFGAVILFFPDVLETVLLPVADHFGFSTAHTVPYIDLATTFAACCGFLYLAVRYASQWLAAAMVVQGAELYFARSYIDSDPPNLHLYALEVNIITITVCSILASAAISSWRGRIRNRREEEARKQRIARRDHELQARYFPHFQPLDAASLPIANAG